MTSGGLTRVASTRMRSGFGGHSSNAFGSGAGIVKLSPWLAE